MKVEINVDEMQFKELLDKQLTELPQEVIQNIIIESIREYFTQNDYQMIENLFINKESRYGYIEKSSSVFLDKLMRECDYSKLQEVVDAAVENLKENNERILKDMLIEALAAKLTDTYSMRQSVEYILRER